MSDTANANNQRSRFCKVNISVFTRVLVPDFLALRVHIIRQPTGKGKHEHHDVLCDVVVVDTARVTDYDRMFNQFRVIVAGEGTCCGVLEPSQIFRQRQLLRRHPTADGIVTEW